MNGIDVYVGFLILKLLLNGIDYRFFILVGKIDAYPRRGFTNGALYLFAVKLLNFTVFLNDVNHLIFP